MKLCGVSVFVVMFVGSVSFTLATENGTWIPRRHFEDSLTGDINNFMRPFYNIMTSFLEKILQPRTIYDLNATLPGGLEGLVDADGDYWANNWSKFVIHYIGYVVCAALGLLFIIFLPLISCCFCCCRCCCGNCGGRLNEKKLYSYKAGCCRYCCGVFFLLFLATATAGVVVMFPASLQIRAQASGGAAIRGLNRTMYDGVSFLREFADSATDGVMDPLRSTRDRSFSVLEGMVDEGFQRLDQETNVETTLGEGVKLFDNLQQNLNTTIKSLRDIRTGIETVNVTLQPIYDDLNCAGDPQCENAKNSLLQKATYSGLIEPAGQLNASKVSGEILQTAASTYVTFRETFRNSSKETIEEIKKSVDDGLNEANKALTQVKNMVTNLTENVKDIEKEFDKFQTDTLSVYAEYVFYGLIGLCCLISLCVVFFYLGFFCGTCGKPADKQSGCNKAKGSCLVMCGVYGFLLIIVLILILCFVLLLAGGLIHTEVCRYFAKPDTYRRDVGFMDSIIQDALPGNFSRLSLNQTLSNCGENKALYTAANLEMFFNLTEVLDLDRLGIRDELDRIQNITIDIGNVEIINQNVNDTLTGLSTYMTSIDTAAFKQETEKEFMRGDLNDAVSYLRSIGNHTQADDVEDIRNQTLPTMEVHREQLRDAIAQVEKVNDETSILGLLDGLSDSQDKLQTKGGAAVREVLTESADQVFDEMRNGVGKIDSNVRDDVGRCGALYDTIMGGVTIVCTSVLYPLNAYWFSHGWTFAFLFIALFMAGKLSTIYRIPERRGSVSDLQAMEMAPPPDYDAIHPPPDYNRVPPLKTQTIPQETKMDFVGVTKKRGGSSKKEKDPPPDY